VANCVLTLLGCKTSHPKQNGRHDKGGKGVEKGDQDFAKPLIWRREGHMGPGKYLKEDHSTGLQNVTAGKKKEKFEGGVSLFGRHLKRGGQTRQRRLLDSPSSDGTSGKYGKEGGKDQCKGGEDSWREVLVKRLCL